MRPWDQDELDWALECLTAGDTYAEVAEWSGRTEDDVRKAFAHLPPLTPLQRQVASCLAAGMNCGEADRWLGVAATTSWTCLRRIWAKNYRLTRAKPVTNADVITGLRHGVTLDELADRFGVTRRTIERRREAALHG